MTLGSRTQATRRTTRYALATLLLAGTAISAPLSLADDPEKTITETVIVTPETTTKTKNVMRWVISDDDSGERKGFEIRETDGEKTYLRVGRDGTTEKMTREELVAEYGEDFDKARTGQRFGLQQIIEGEPGLTALSQNGDALTELQTVIVSKFSEGDQKLRVEVEDGERRVFKVAPDGTETLLNLDTLGADSDVKLHILKDMDGAEFPGQLGGNVMILKSENATKLFGSDTSEPAIIEESGNTFLFAPNDPASSEARLRSAQSMLEMSLRMLDDVQDESDGADRDLRDAEKELERARKALDKAMSAMKKAGETK